MKITSIGSRIVASFGVIVVIILAMATLTIIGLGEIEGHVASIRKDTVPGLYQSMRLKATALDNYAVVAGFATHTDPAAKRNAEAAVRASNAEYESTLREYESTVLAAEDRRLLDAVKAAQIGYFAAQKEVLAGGYDALSRVDEQFRPQHLKLQAAITPLAERNYVAGLADSASINTEIRDIEFFMAVGFALVVLLALVSGYLLYRTITRPLGNLVAAMDVVGQGDFTRRIESDRKDEFGVLAGGFDRMADEVMGLIGHVQKSGIQVSTSMNEIAATSKQQQATASEIAATTTEVGATSREISATSKELVRTMNEVASVAEQTATLATDGQTGLSRMQETMHRVMEAAGSVSAKFTVLSEKAGTINSVVSVITKVADQTNLLSLNAAIEAEKAGESGRGFAVVASEIRRLADRTAVATYDIERMVKEIESAVSAGVMGMDKFSEEVRRGIQDIQNVGGQLTQIIQQVQALVPRFETVNDGMQAQATGAEQISEALLQLTEAVQQTVESLRQSTMAIDNLNQVSGNLGSSVSRFKLEAA